MLLLATTLALAAAQVADFVEIPGEREFTGELLATPKSDAPVRAVTEALAPYTVIEHAPGPNRYVLAPQQPSSEPETARALLSTELFESVEPNWRVFPCSVPSDPLFGSQWHHAPDRMNTAAAWDLHTGRFPVTVTLCDSGLRIDHEDLRANRREGYNAVDRLWEREGGLISEVFPHGTSSSGCVAATGNNGLGVVGVGWNLRFRMMRVTNRSDGGASMSELLHAAELAAEIGDRVMSVPYSGVTSPSARSTATYIRSLGGVLLWAAGNQGTDQLDWGDRDADDLIVVGATLQDDSRARDSNTGPALDLVAPGRNIWTTEGSQIDGYGPHGGTSISTSLAAGLFGLLFSMSPGLTSLEAETIIKQGCDDVGIPGIDPETGYGRIDAYETLRQATPQRHELTMLLSATRPIQSGSDTFQANDIVRYRRGVSDFELVFDCSDVLNTTSNLDAFTRLQDGSLLLSFEDDNILVPGVGLVDDEDLVLFAPTSLGAQTDGTFHEYFDGSDVGLGEREGEDINGVTVEPSTGNLFLTFRGPWRLPDRLIGRNEDVVEFRPVTLGPRAQGNGHWIVAFNGRHGPDEVMRDPGEQIDALDYRELSGEWCFSTGGAFRVNPNSLSGKQNDLLFYEIETFGDEGTGFQILTFLGDANGLAGINIDGLFIEE